MSAVTPARPPRPIAARLAGLLAGLLVGLALVLGACSDGSPGRSGDAGDRTTGSTAPGGAVRAPASDGPAAGACGDQPAVTPGVTHLTLDDPSGARTIRQFLPSSYDPARPTPVVVNLHGYLSNADQQAALSGMEQLAEEEGFVVLFPEGTGTPRHWNIWRNPSGADDVAFLRAVVDDAAARLCIDRDRVYLTGLSNGAGMTSTAACSLFDVYAAFAPVAGLIGTDFCEEGAGAPVPVVAFHGSADPLLAYEGGYGPNAATLPPLQGPVADDFARYPSPDREDAAAAWAAYDGCDPEPEVEEVAGTSGTVRRIAFAGCSDGVEVALYRVEGGGHTWPGSSALAAFASLVGPSTAVPDANRVMWDFFVEHPRRAGGAEATGE